MESQKATVFRGNKFMTSENQNEPTGSTDVFNAEIYHELTHLSSSKELQLSQMMRSSKRQHTSLKNSVIENHFASKSLAVENMIMWLIDKLHKCVIYFLLTAYYFIFHFKQRTGFREEDSLLLGFIVSQGNIKVCFIFRKSLGGCWKRGVV